MLDELLDGNQDLLAYENIEFDAEEAYLDKCWQQVVAGYNYWFEFTVQGGPNGNRDESHYVKIFEPLAYTNDLPSFECISTANNFNFECDN